MPMTSLVFTQNAYLRRYLTDSNFKAKNTIAVRDVMGRGW